MTLKELGLQGPSPTQTTPESGMSYCGDFDENAAVRDRPVTFHANTPSTNIPFTMVGIEVNVAFVRPDYRCVEEGIHLLWM